LERLSFGGSQIKDTVVAQSKILLFWYCTTYLLLEKNKPKYQPLEPHPIDQLQPENPAEVVEDEVKDSLPEQMEPKDEPEPLNEQIRPFILEGL